MSYELDEQFIARITAPLRRLHEQPPLTLGLHANTLLHGTTIGAFTVNHGQSAIAFSDGKVSMGSTPVHLAFRKILSVDPYTRMLISGSPVMGVHYAAALKGWIGYREDTSGQPVSARAKTRYLSRLLMGGLSLVHAGIVCGPILVTYDIREKKTARIFSLGVDGSEIEHHDCTVAGSGEKINVMLKEKWRPDLTIKKGIQLARGLILKTAPENDSFSGGKVSIDVIGPDGIRTIP